MYSRWVSFFSKKKTCDVTCLAMDALQWMGAVRMRDQTADQILWSKKMCTFFKLLLLAKIPIYNNVSFSEKVPPFCPLTTMFTYMFRTVVECLLDLFIFLSWFRQDEFFTEESNMTHFSRKQHFEVTNVLMIWFCLFRTQSVSLLKMLIDVWISCMDYLRMIVMFLSAVWTLILTAPIHRRASIGELVM